MANVFFRSRATRIAPDELAARLRTALDTAVPGADLTVDTDESGARLAWHDGPSASRVAAVAAGIVNWPARGAGPAPTDEKGPAVIIDRSFSDRALAVAVVRYQASHVRHYDSGDARAVADLSALLDVDDPARSGYPVPDAMADLLLAAPEPPPSADDGYASPADRLSAKLHTIGYDNLWRVAWAAVE